jgi:hypothetical protein
MKVRLTTDKLTNKVWRVSRGDKTIGRIHRLYTGEYFFNAKPMEFLHWTELSELAAFMKNAEDNEKGKSYEEDPVVVYSAVDDAGMCSWVVDLRPSHAKSVHGSDPDPGGQPESPSGRKSRSGSLE